MPPPPSLSVLGGPLDGTRVVLQAGEVTIGSDPSCRLVVALPGVSPLHARVVPGSAGVVVQEGNSPAGVYVNDDRVHGHAPLRDGDILWLGPPGGDASVMIHCRLGALPPAPSPAPPPSHEEFILDATLDGPRAEEFVVSDPVAGDEVFFLEEGPPAAPPKPVVPPPPVSVTASVPPPPPAAPAPPRMPAAPAAPLPPPVPQGIPPRPPTAPPLPHSVPEDDVFVAQEEPPPALPPSAARPPAPKAPPAPAGARAPTGGARPAAARPATRPQAPSGPSPVPIRPAPTTRPPARQRMVPGRRGPHPGVLAGAAVALAAAGAGGYLAWRVTTTPALQSVSPPRLAPGQPATLVGTNFAADPKANVVFFGSLPGRVLEAAPTQLKVEVPELAVAPGQDTPVAVSVQVAGRQTAPIQVMAYGAPRIHGLSPDVTMPGEDVVLAGTGFSPGAKVRFGSAAAEIIQQTPSSLRVRVPALDGQPGTTFQVTVSVGADGSNPIPFMLGRLPMLLSVQPGTVAPGELVTVTGRGLAAAARDNMVRVAGAPALVASASGDELAFVVPRLPPGTTQAPVEIRVAGRPDPASATLTVPPPPDAVEFRFVAEPFADVDGHDHAVLASDLGPAFLFSASRGMSAAQRALEAQKRLAAAAVLLRASREADLEARHLQDAAVVGLAGRNEVVLEPTDEDAAGYGEDWTRGGGKGGPVTRARLALWWAAVARDLVLLLVRSEKPHFAADLAPEGRVLAEIFMLARKGSTFGLPRRLLGEIKPAQREALRVLGLRVPDKVADPAGAAPPVAAPSAAAPGLAPLSLEGVWRGVELEAGRRKPISVSFRGAGGTYAYEGGVVLSMPLLQVQPQKDGVRFAFASRGFVRYYVGKWDGRTLAGSISSDPSGKGDIGSFELVPRR